MTGPCATQFDHSLAAGQDPTQALAWDNTTHGASGSSLALASTNGGSSSTTTTGCNVFTADNRTLVPLLLDQGLLSSRDMLLVLLQSNISLGHQEHMPAGHIKLGRPVALAGLFTIPTGIDFEMRPNQLVSAQAWRVQYTQSSAAHTSATVPVRCKLSLCTTVAGTVPLSQTHPAAAKAMISTQCMAMTTVLLGNIHVAGCMFSETLLPGA